MFQAIFFSHVIPAKRQAQSRDRRATGLCLYRVQWNGFRALRSRISASLRPGWRPGSKLHASSWDRKPKLLSASFQTS